MKCAVYYGKQDLRVEERPVPRPGRGEVLVRVMACGVCGTDVHIFQGDPGAADCPPGTVRPAKMKEFERQKTTDFSFVRRYTNASSFSCPVHERYLFKIRPGSISHAAGPLFLYFWPDIGSAEREKSYAHHGAGLLV